MWRFYRAMPPFRKSVFASVCARSTSSLDAYARSYSRAAIHPDHAVNLRSFETLMRQTEWREKRIGPGFLSRIR